MADDRLHAFRNPSTRTQAATPQADPDEDKEFEPSDLAYEPFRVGSRQLSRLSVQPVSEPWVFPSYRYLLNVLTDGPHGTYIVLIYTFMAVKIVGRNLQPIASALARERCAFVQQYDLQRWGEALEPNTPVITSLIIEMEKSPAQVADEAANASAEDQEA